jgi:predicted ATP-binding protein involved in virulence
MTPIEQLPAHNLLRIERVRLHNFGPFSRFSLEFQKTPEHLAEIHIFTGPNGSGKTSLIAAMSGIHGADGSGILELRPRCKGLFSSITLDYGDGNELRFRTANSSNEKGVLRREHDFEIAANGEARFQTTIQHLLGPVSAANANQPVAACVLSYSGHHLVHSGNIQNFEEPAKLSSRRQAASFNRAANDFAVQWIANLCAKIAFAKSDNDPVAVKGYESDLAKVCKAISEIIGSDFELKIQREPLMVLASWNGQSIPVSGLPDGLKAILGLIADVGMRLTAQSWDNPYELFEHPFVLFLDEIDIHLHPKWQRHILPVLQRLFKNAQIFVTTHSPFVVGSVSDAWVYKLDPSKESETAVPSGSGQSYMTVLQEIFGVEEEFDPETQRLFDEFFKARTEALKSKDLSTLEAVAEQLVHRGAEVDDIVNAELLQVKRRMQAA